MSRKVDKKIDDLTEKFAKVLTHTGLEQGEFAMECKIQPATLSKALDRSSLSSDIVNKIFDRFGVRKGFWQDGKDPVFAENHTPVQKEPAIPEKPLGAEFFQTFRKMVEGDTEYLLIPRAVLEDTELISSRQLTAALSQMEKDRRIMEIIITENTRLTERLLAVSEVKSSAAQKGKQNV